MSAIVCDARALLRTFEHSGCRDLLVRSGDFTLFIARADGGANPLRACDADRGRLVPQGAETHVVQAPHLGTFLSALAPGSAVGKDMAVARIGLLDEVIDIAADRAGVVCDILQGPGDLVEYGAPLVRLAPG